MPPEAWVRVYRHAGNGVVAALGATGDRAVVRVSEQIRLCAIGD